MGRGAGAVSSAVIPDGGRPPAALVQAGEALCQPLVVVPMLQHGVLQELCGCGSLVSVLLQACSHHAFQCLNSKGDGKLPGAPFCARPIIEHVWPSKQVSKVLSFCMSKDKDL